MDADGNGLASEWAAVLDDQRVRQGLLGESLGEAPQGGFIRHRERYDDRRRMARGLGGCMGNLSNLHPVGEVSSN